MNQNPVQWIENQIEGFELRFTIILINRFTPSPEVDLNLGGERPFNPQLGASVQFQVLKDSLILKILLRWLLFQPLVTACSCYVVKIYTIVGQHLWFAVFPFLLHKKNLPWDWFSLKITICTGICKQIYACISYGRELVILVLNLTDVHLEYLGVTGALKLLLAKFVTILSIFHLLYQYIKVHVSCITEESKNTEHYHYFSQATCKNLLK